MPSAKDAAQGRKGFSLTDFVKETVTGAVTGGLAGATFYGAGKAVEAVKESIKGGSKTYTVDSVMQAKDIETGVLIDGAYIKNPTAQNISNLIKPGSNYVGNSKMNGQFMYVVDMNGNIVIGSRAGQHMPHPA